MNTIKFFSLIIFCVIVLPLQAQINSSYRSDYIGLSFQEVKKKERDFVPNKEYWTVDESRTNYGLFTEITIIQNKKGSYIDLGNGRYSYDEPSQYMSIYVIKNGLICLIETSSGTCTREDEQFFTKGCKYISDRKIEGRVYSIYECSKVILLRYCDQQVNYTREWSVSSISDFYDYLKAKREKYEIALEQIRQDELSRINKKNYFLKCRDSIYYDYAALQPEDAKILSNQIRENIKLEVLNANFQQLNFLYNIVLYKNVTKFKGYDRTRLRDSSSVKVLSESVTDYHKQLLTVLSKQKLKDCYSKEYPTYDLNTKLELEIDVKMSKDFVKVKKKGNGEIVFDNKLSEEYKKEISDTLASSKKGVYKIKVFNLSVNEEKYQELKIEGYR